MPTQTEVMDLVNYVFDEILPKTKEDVREEFAYVMMDEMVGQGWLELDDEDDEEQDEDSDDVVAEDSEDGVL